MSLDIAVPSGTGADPGFDVRRGGGALSIGVGPMLGGSAIFGVNRDANSALVNVFPVSSGAGWTVYTFRHTSAFTLRANVVVTADVLRVGGGGSGGAGNECGGGGGPGEVIDLHCVEIVAGETDGDVVVGAGGAEVSMEYAVAHNAGHRGEDSSFGGVVAAGGGYGAGNDWVPFHYVASDGGSGGGGDPWSNGLEEGQPWYHGHGGMATAAAYSCNTRIPYDPGSYTDAEAERYALAPYGQSGYWEDAGGHKFWRVTRAGGHDGRFGWGYTAWYNVTCGGGGGAHEPWRTVDGAQQPWYHYDQFGLMQSGRPEHGGHGVPCDIAGYGPLWIASNQTGRMVRWYGGGGAGKEQKVWWSYPNGRPGYGGGGEVNEPGVNGTGGGGGGAGNYPTSMPGPAGGDGTVIVRIRTADERYVTFPPITGVDPETGQPTTSDSANVTITRLDSSQPHTDISGDEQCPRTYEETH